MHQKHEALLREADLPEDLNLLIGRVATFSISGHEEDAEDNPGEPRTGIVAGRISGIQFQGDAEDDDDGVMSINLFLNTEEDGSCLWYIQGTGEWLWVQVYEDANLSHTGTLTLPLAS